MVKIHGNYCGPGWTGGKPFVASDPRVNWKVSCLDALDCACKDHDWDCRHPDGCSRKADRILAAKAAWISLTNRRLRPKAQAIAAALTAASHTRRR